MSAKPSEISAEIKEMALKLGFSACGITHLEPFCEEAEIFRIFLNNNCHGNMKFLEEHFDKRTSPDKLLPGTKSVIVLAAAYYHTDELRVGNYKIARYASGQDYHKVLKKRVKPLLNYLTTEAGATFARMYCDSAPVFEKAFAVRAGLGFQGKNSTLIIPNAGSFFFLAEIYTDAVLSFDSPYDMHHCGSCTKCIEACPSNAIHIDGGINASRCLSYVNIENKEFPLHYSFDPQAWIYGCDICQDVCPHNKHINLPVFDEFLPTESLLQLTEEKLKAMDDNNFQKLFVGSPIKRIGLERLKRNVEAADEWL